MFKKFCDICGRRTLSSQELVLPKKKFYPNPITGEQGRVRINLFRFEHVCEQCLEEIATKLEDENGNWVR